MKISSEQIQKDIDFLTLHIEDKEEINQILEHIEKIGVGSAEYFCEEFVFIPDGETTEQVSRLHDPEYLDISEFNYHHWIGNDIQEDY